MGIDTDLWALPLGPFPSLFCFPVTCKDWENSLEHVIFGRALGQIIFACAQIPCKMGVQREEERKFPSVLEYCQKHLWQSPTICSVALGGPVAVPTKVPDRPLQGSSWSSQDLSTDVTIPGQDPLLVTTSA